MQSVGLKVPSPQEQTDGLLIVERSYEDEEVMTASSKIIYWKKNNSIQDLQFVPL